MKTILLNALLILLVLSSCSTKKSFTHQRYTSYGHGKHKTVVAESKEKYASVRNNNTPKEAPITVNVPAEQSSPAVTVQNNSDVLTASAAQAATLKQHAPASLAKATAAYKSLTSGLSKSEVKALAKQVKKEQKRGLLFGIIDAILAIILAVVFVGLIVLLVLVLI